MSRGDAVVYLPDPLTHGVGEIKGHTPHGWLWVEWADGTFDSYDPQALEHAAVWEDRFLRSAA